MSEASRGVSHRAVGSIYGTYTVKFKIPIVIVASRRNKKFHARILADGGIVLTVYGTEIVAAYKEINVDVFAVVSRIKHGEGLVLIFAPVCVLDRACNAFILKC